MHTRELIDLAAIVSIHGPVLVRDAGVISDTSIEDYWTASKCRLDRWGRALKSLSVKLANAQPTSGCRTSQQVRGVLEEILTGEILTRVWTTVMCAYDRHRGTDLMEPVVRSILIGHLEARHRVLTLLVNGSGIDTEQAVKLNRLRQRTERWTDMLVGYLAGVHDISEFAIDPERAEEFAEDLSYRSRLPGGRHAWPLIQASLRSGFSKGLAPTSPNADLNQKIAASILSCLPPEVFDGTGLFRSIWMTRLSNVTSDTQGMIDQLIGAPQPHHADTAASLGSRPSVDRIRRFGP
jgi:hypothetical protein